MKKTPRRIVGDATGIPLSRLESFVLSRVDGQLSVRDIVDLTGLATPQVEQILTRLSERGAIEVAEDPSVPHLDELLADEPLAHAHEIVDSVPGAIAPPSESWIAENLPEASPLGGTRDDPPDSQLELPPDEEWGSADDDDGPTDTGAESLDNLPEDPDAPEGEEGEEGEAKKHPSLVPAEGDVTDPSEAPEHEIQNYRKLFETKYRIMTPDERFKAARLVDGADLFALCFDPDPHVIKGILENDRASLDHARLIAAHHRNPVGLAALCERVSILKDARVQRMLLRNTQLTDALARKILMPKRLFEIYKASNDRDITDRTRNTAKGLFKGKFSRATPEEKFEVIWNTEGRVLPALLGQTIDMKTAALFCARNFTSVVLIQAFARFPATPPSILSHILRQPLVKRQVHLRNMVLQHPNVPSEAKRKF
jgi:hypothetical protein